MENEDNKGMGKSLVRICIGVGVILGGIFAFGIGSIFWKYYTIKRNPVYQTTMTDFEIRDDFDENITQKFRLTLKKWFLNL